MPVYALGEQEPAIDPTAYVHPDAVIIGDVTVGPEASVWPGAVLRGDMGVIRVGARTSIQDNTVLHTTAEWPTVIGADCVVGHAAHLEGCTVEDRCLVGSGSVVLNRVHIGRDSVVGAQALVAEDTVVPAGTMMLGVPARPRPLDVAEQTAWIDYGVQEYLDKARRYRGELRRLEPTPTAQPRPSREER
jgi:carbonic anhydrase/acetyltransferase-like protein (isoleucine patch superfamily)